MDIEKKENKIMPEQNTPVSAVAHVKAIRVSHRKLSLVAGLIRNMKADKALEQLRFLRKKVAKDVGACLSSAISNADNNLNLDIDSLYVSKVLVGKSVSMKRMMPRAKGRGCRIIKQFSRLTIVVEERNL